MKTNKDDHVPRKRTKKFKQFDLAELNAQRRLPEKHAQQTRHGVYNVSEKTLTQRELLNLIASENVSRATKVVTIARLEDTDLLLGLAVGRIPIAMRKNALLRIDDLISEAPLEKEKAAYLVPCLVEKELIAFAAVIMDVCGHSWCGDCEEEAVNALGAALRECVCLHERILLEDAFAQLAHSRPDLSQKLYVSSPEKFLSETVYAPLEMTNRAFLSLLKKEVA